MIYVDSKPVYFSWSTNIQPYSFSIDSGYHTIKLRTSRNTFELDSIFFHAGQKSIISIRDSIINPGVRISKEEPRLSSFEKGLLFKYIFPYRYNYGDHYAYLKQDEQIQFLKPATPQNRMNLAGPVYPTPTQFQLADSFSIGFTPESLVEYEFMPDLVKMRSVDPKFRYPESLYNYKAKESLTDESLTEMDMISGWNEFKDWKRYTTSSYNNPRVTESGMGKLEISLLNEPLKSDKHALNVLLFRYDDHKFLRIYPGSTMIYNNLSEGYYKVLLFYPGSSYSILDSLYVSVNGLNFHEIEQKTTSPKDSFSIYISKIIEKNLVSAKPYYRTEKTELNYITNAYHQKFQYTSDGNIISGYVYDNENLPVPGVSIVIKGTNYGTISDLNGFYSINVPKNRNELIFSFIGYKEEVIDISYGNNVDVYMTEDVMGLDEVVVIGYGSQKKSSLTGSVSSLSTSGIPGIESNMAGTLQRKISGIEIIKSGIPGDGVSILIRGANTVNFAAEPLYIIDGVVYMGDISALNPHLIKNIQILKDADATAIYGAKGANGVVIINTGGNFKPTQSMDSTVPDDELPFSTESLKESSIRNNFSDYAFWEPQLTTDKEGKVTFTTKFPDDVTNWRTFYLAMNGKKQTGQTEGSIKSYKALMAQLAVPRFLIESDTAYAIGKVLNYTPDSVLLTTKFEVDGKLMLEKEENCSRSIIDTLQLIAGLTDSLSVKYYLEKEDGFFDGEQRYVRLYPQGLEQTAGQFHTLQGDTSMILSFDTISEETTIYARADVLDVIEDEISKLIRYQYACNEQLASKLKALLSEQLIFRYQEKPFKKENEVEKMIRLLLKNQHNEGLWGWWKSSKETSLWISLHVLESLAQAKEMDYKVDLNIGKISDLLVWELESPIKADNKLRALRILEVLNAKVNFPVYIERLEKTENLNLNEYFRLIELKQNYGLDPKTDTINSYRKETVFGNLYFSDDSVSRKFYMDDLQSTLIAYRILKSDSTKNHTNELQRIRNYVFENRSRGSWRNTYESSRIIETILPDLLGSGKKLIQPELTISGAVNKTVNEFPFKAEVSSRETIQVKKKGDFPVYITAYSRFWNPKPSEKKSEFEISTRFDKSQNNILKAGEPVKMIVSVQVLKDADYLLINVPIPAGCSYGNKSGSSILEVHREYFRNETAIFCEFLRAGHHEFTIELIPRYTGKYTMNPAKVEMMYFPTFNANNRIQKIRIE